MQPWSAVPLVPVRGGGIIKIFLSLIDRFLRQRPFSLLSPLPCGLLLVGYYSQSSMDKGLISSSLPLLAWVWGETPYLLRRALKWMTSHEGKNVINCRAVRPWSLEACWLFLPMLLVWFIVVICRIKANSSMIYYSRILDFIIGITSLWRTKSLISPQARIC